MFGCNSNIGYVNLTTKEIRIEPLPEDVLLSYIGGRGLNSYLLFKHFRKLTSPLDPENIIVISAGLFVNTSMPSSGRTCISTLMNAEGTSFSDGNLGGRFSVALKSAGVDVLFITGALKTLSYILVENGEVTIHPCLNLISKDTYETDEILRAQYPNSRSICIGPAGESLSPFANVMHEDRSASVPGCVWGSKKLKAVVASHSPRLSLAKNQEKFSQDCLEIDKYLKSHPLYGTFSKYGTKLLSKVHNKIGNYPAYNWKYGTDNASVNNINEETAFVRGVSEEEKKKEFEKENFACFNCALGGCSQPYDLPGKRRVYKLEYEANNCFSGKIGKDSLEDVLQLNLFCNNRGIDLIKITSVLSTLMEMNNIPFSPSLEDTIGYINKVVYEGISVYLKTEKDWSEYKDRFVEVKGKAVSSFDPRIGWGPALSCATASRGGDHLRSLPTILSYFDWYNQTFGKDNLTKFSKWCGIPIEVLQLWIDSGTFTEGIDGKELVVKYYQEVNALFDSLGMCRFMSPWRFGIGYDNLVSPFSSLTGISWSSEDIRKVGERISAIERILLQKYNQRDYLP